MSRPTLFVLALLTVSSMTLPAAAGIPYVGFIDFFADEEASIVVVPDGSGRPLTEARSYGGAEIDATVQVQLVDVLFNPIANFPAEDLWLQFEVDPGTATGCTTYGDSFPGGVFLADGATDAGGYTEWIEPLLGGGWSEGPTWVYLNGIRARGPNLILHPPLDLRANSPDLSGDRRVDLTDITLFVQDLGGPYHYRSDLHWDAAIDLADIVLFVYGLGATCP